MLACQRFLGLHLSMAFIILLASCATLPPYTDLPEAEQKLYRVYRRIMTHAQLQTYLSLPTPAEREAFANHIGAARLIDALPEQERTAVLDGHPFEGMSSQALYLLWGEPYLREGPQETIFPCRKLAAAKATEAPSWKSPSKTGLSYGGKKRFRLIGVAFLSDIPFSTIRIIKLS